LNIISVIVEEFGNLLFSSRSSLNQIDFSDTDAVQTNVEEEESKDEKTDDHEKIHRHEEL